MSERVELHGLSIDRTLHELVAGEIAPGTGTDADELWRQLAGIVTDLGGKNRTLLSVRVSRRRTA